MVAGTESAAQAPDVGSEESQNPAGGGEMGDSGSGQERNATLVSVSYSGGGGVRALLVSKHSLATLNVRGGLKFPVSGKLLGIMSRVRALRIGVLALQETNMSGVVRRTVRDLDGHSFSFCNGGPITNSQGTGFLVSSDLEVLFFRALSSRVSLIEVCPQKDNLRNRGNRSVFISCYAPTEQGGKMTADERASEMIEFYTQLREAITESRKRCEGQSPIVCGDFNIGLTRDTRDGHVSRWLGVTGKLRLPGGTPSLHTHELLNFCEREGYVILNSRLPRYSFARPTWYHPRTGQGSIKDLILGPSRSLGKDSRHGGVERFVDSASVVQPWVATDHMMVVVRLNWSSVECDVPRGSGPVRGISDSHRAQGSRQTNRDSLAEKVKKLDLRTGLRDPKLRTDYAEKLQAGLLLNEPNWNGTQTAMHRALLDTMPSRTTRARQEKDTWFDGYADDLRVLWAQAGRLQESIDVCRLAGKRDSADFRDKVLAIRAVRERIRKTTEHAKTEYRKFWGQVWNRHPERRKEAESRLKTDGCSSVEQLEQIEPKAFSDHFTKLFGKQSDSQTILPVGTACPTNWKLSGVPSMEEVQNVIDGLNPRKAAGGDSLPAEAFKLGGEALTRRMTEILVELWPSEETWRTDIDAGPIHGRTTRATDGEYLKCSATVSQSWQDAELVSIFKNKGSALDPGNYRGIFLLEVAGKILAGVLNRRLQKLSEEKLSDFQCGFRPRRGAAQQILAIRRAQQALREVKKDACILFIDFAKAFDSPPREAIYSCLRHLGCPPDVLAMVEAIHEKPSATVRNSDESFEMARGIRQGCLLGPTLFIILLDYLLEQTDCREPLGVTFVCKSRGAFDCPDDLKEHTFSLTDGEYADDCWMLAETPEALTEALRRLQLAGGPLGLDVSVKKTEWLWLSGTENHPWVYGGEDGQVGDLSRDEMRAIVHLSGQMCKRVRSFEYLGSNISEDGGIASEIADRISKSMTALGGLNTVWGNSEISRRAKVRLLMSRVVPVLLYGAETWDTTEADLCQLDVFLNKCRQRIAGVSRLRPDGSVLSNAELHRMVRVGSPHQMIAQRRLAFICQVVAKGFCQLARKMVFAEVPKLVNGLVSVRIPGRMRRDLRNVWGTDLINIGLDQAQLTVHVAGLMQTALTGKPGDLRKVLIPTKLGMSRKRLVGSRQMNFVCTERLCYFQCCEQKELTRHVKTSHSGGNLSAIESTAAKESSSHPTRHRETPHSENILSAPGAAAALSSLTNDLSEAGCRTDPESGGTFVWTGLGPPYICMIGGCRHEYKLKGKHLLNHIATVHKLTARFECHETAQAREFETQRTDVDPELAAESRVLEETAGGREAISSSSVCSVSSRAAVETDSSDLQGITGGVLGAVRCIAEGETTVAVYCDGQGKRLTSLGVNSGNVFQPWSRNVVPTSCPFEKCSYPLGGISRSWKTWQNHCSTDHEWNIASGVKSRKRAGKDMAGAEKTLKASAGKPVGARRGSPNPKVKSNSLTLGAQTVVANFGNESRSGKRGTRETEEPGCAPPGTRGRALRALAIRDA